MGVSVIITAYNVERYITRAIDSALGLQGVNLELIVVDDASIDGTWDVISKYSDPRIKPLRLTTNRGPGAARNAGLTFATENWVAILDGDDAFEPSRLAKCLAHGTQANANIIVDNLMVCREKDGKEFPMFTPDIFSTLGMLDAATFIKGTLSQNNNYTLGYLKPIFSHDFLKNHGLSYNENLRIGEDYQFLLEALLLGARCTIAPDIGYRYTARIGSISYRLSLDDITRMMQADEKLLSHYTLDKHAAAAQKARMKNLQKECAYTQLLACIKQKNLRDCMVAIASNPACIWLLWRPLKVRIKRWFYDE